MNREQIIRAWKDSEYRESLSDAEQALLPDHPAGLIELSHAQLGAVTGRESVTAEIGTVGCCETEGILRPCGTYKIFSFGCTCGKQT